MLKNANMERNSLSLRLVTLRVRTVEIFAFQDTGFNQVRYMYIVLKKAPAYIFSKFCVVMYPGGVSGSAAVRPFRDPRATPAYDRRMTRYASAFSPAPQSEFDELLAWAQSRLFGRDRSESPGYR